MTEDQAPTVDEIANAITAFGRAWTEAFESMAQKYAALADAINRSAGEGI